MSENLKLSAPWVTYYHEVYALFGNDPDINIKFDANTPELKLFVEDGRKADALAKLLPEEKVYGNITLKIAVVPANLKDSDDPEKLFKDAFYGNPVLSEFYSLDTVLGHFNYAEFEADVVQFFNDQMDDLNGNRTTLYQDIAKDVFDDKYSVNYCTVPLKRELKKPLGEWP